MTGWVRVSPVWYPRVVLRADLPAGKVAFLDGGGGAAHKDEQAVIGWARLYAAGDGARVRAAAELAATAYAAATRARTAGGTVAVVGAGALATLVRMALSETTADDADVIVDTTGFRRCIADSVGRVRDLGTVLLAARPQSSELLVRTYADIHRRGLTVAGVPWCADATPSAPPQMTEWASAHVVMAVTGKATVAAPWYCLDRP